MSRKTKSQTQNPDTLPETQPQNPPEMDQSLTTTEPATGEADTKAAKLLSDGAGTFKVADDPELDGSDGDETIRPLDEDGNEVVQPAADKPFVLMSEDAFFDQFCMAFEAPGMVSKDWEPLAIPDEEKGGARLVSNRLYHRCANSSWSFLRDFVNDNGGALLEWGMMAHFAIGRSRAVGQIVAAKQAKPPQAGTAQASPDTAPEASDYAAPVV